MECVNQMYVTVSFYKYFYYTLLYTYIKLLLYKTAVL